MLRKYETEEDVLELVKAFEGATISRDEWKHGEHLVVALYYLSRNDMETAVDKMRTGILNLLENGFGVDLEKEMPYHETITIFWMRTLGRFLSASNGAGIGDKVREMLDLFDKNYPLKFYSRERLFSDEARARFLEADLNDDINRL